MSSSCEDKCYVDVVQIDGDEDTYSNIGATILRAPTYSYEEEGDNHGEKSIDHCDNDARLAQCRPAFWIARTCLESDRRCQDTKTLMGVRVSLKRSNASKC